MSTANLLRYTWLIFWCLKKSHFQKQDFCAITEYQFELKCLHLSEYVCNCRSNTVYRNRNLITSGKNYFPTSFILRSPTESSILFVLQIQRQETWWKNAADHFFPFCDIPLRTSVCVFLYVPQSTFVAKYTEMKFSLIFISYFGVKKSY